MKPNTILEDERPIQALVWEDSFNLEIGAVIEKFVDPRTVTKIVAYGEPSQYCNVPWFAIYAGDDIVIRVPATQVSVQYAIPEDEAEENG